jgi:hypothetical protein
MGVERPSYINEVEKLFLENLLPSQGSREGWSNKLLLYPLQAPPGRGEGTLKRLLHDLKRVIERALYRVVIPPPGSP